MTVLMSNYPQQISVTNPDKTLFGSLLGTGETGGENPQTETELRQAVK